MCCFSSIVVVLRSEEYVYLRYDRAGTRRYTYSSKVIIFKQNIFNWLLHILCLLQPDKCAEQSSHLWTGILHPITFFFSFWHWYSISTWVERRAMQSKSNPCGVAAMEIKAGYRISWSHDFNHYLKNKTFRGGKRLATSLSWVYACYAWINGFTLFWMCLDVF